MHSGHQLRPICNMHDDLVQWISSVQYSTVQYGGYPLYFLSLPPTASSAEIPTRNVSQDQIKLWLYCIQYSVLYHTVLNH